MLSKDEMQSLKSRLLANKAEREKTPHERWLEEQQRQDADEARRAGEYASEHKRIYDGLDYPTAVSTTQMNHACACIGDAYCCIYRMKIAKKWLEDHDYDT